MGPQPPQNGCSVKGTREVKVTVDADSPVIKIPVGKWKLCTSWMVDSGASMNVIDEVSFKEVYPGLELNKMPSDLSFKSADGSPMHMLGYFNSEFWVGTGVKRDEVYVCKGTVKTRLLGASLLAKFSHWGVDNRRGVFIADGERIPLIRSVGNPPRTTEVLLKEAVEVPAGCSKFIRAVLPQRYTPAEFVFRPEEKMFRKRELLLPVCLVANDCLDGEVVVRVTNVGEEAKHLGKGTRIGKVVANVDEYELVDTGDQEGCGINNVKVSSEGVLEMEKQLKESHVELYNLYVRSGPMLDQGERHELLRLLFEYRDVFSVDDYDLGTSTIIKHKIVPKSDKVVYRRQYRHTEEQHKQVDEEVEKLLKSGVIKESTSPFNNPVLMVPKSEPGKWRFCLDCRYINDLTEDQYFPIPLIDEAMDSLAGSTIFTDMDMTSGYHQVDLDDETSDMCAFSTRKGHFQYKKLPMGLRGSGMTFQKMVTLLMSGMLHTEVLAYLDDFILFGRSVEQHMGTLREVLSRLRKAGLKLKPRKCNLFQDELVYLGFLVNKDGIRPNPEAVRKIKELPEPTSVCEVQRFLGKANYYRKFVPKLAEIAHPLYELTKSKGKNQFLWEAEHQSAFDCLKSILCSNVVMGYPRFDQEFILDVDASDYALGIELSQKDENGDERPVFYGSRHLEKSERSYSATARETLAAVFGCEYFKQYLQGRKFILRSDHNPLVWLRSMKDPKRPYNGWIVRLEQFHYEIQYRPGKQHVNADFNSRILPTEEEMGQRTIGTQTVELCSMQEGATAGKGRDPEHRGSSMVIVTGDQREDKLKERIPPLSMQMDAAKGVACLPCRSSKQIGQPKSESDQQRKDTVEVTPQLSMQTDAAIGLVSLQGKSSEAKGDIVSASSQSEGSADKNRPEERMSNISMQEAAAGKSDRLQEETLNLSMQTDAANGLINQQGKSSKAEGDFMSVSKHGEGSAGENTSEGRRSNISIQVAGAEMDDGLQGRLLEGAVIREGAAYQGREGDGVEVETEVPGSLLARQQEVDPDIGPVLRKLQQPEEKVDFTEKGNRLWKVKKNLEVKEGLLVRYHRFGPGRKPIEQVVLPDSLKEMVMESLHDDILSGHFGVLKTMARVKLRYYWPGYLKDVEEWCRTCTECQHRKSPRSMNRAPLQSIDTGEGPFEKIALDILKLPVTARKNQYVLLIEDYFSKWVEAFPLTRTVAPSVAQCVLNGWVSRFGCPFSILSDQGSEFESKLFKCLNNMLQSSKLRTTTYHPRTDGMVERSNRTLIDVLSKYAEKEPDWDLKLPLVLFAMRTSEHATTGFSPFLLTYGREARVPWDILYGPPANEPLPHEKWVASRKQDMTKIFELVKERTQTAQKHQKQYYDRNLKGRFQEFEVGDFVMICDPASRAKEGKLRRPWSGPYEIINKLSEALYSIMVAGKRKVVNTERLKKYHPRASRMEEEATLIPSDTESEEENDYIDAREDIELEEPAVNAEMQDQPLEEPAVNAEMQDQPLDILPGREPAVPGQPAMLPDREPTVPLMGHRGEKWCNIDKNNVITGSRRRRKD